VCCSFYFLGTAFLQRAIVLVILPISSAQWVEITAVLHVFRAAWAFGVLFLLVFCEDAFLRAGRGRGFYRWVSERSARWPSRGPIAWIYLSNREKRIGMSSEI